MKVKSIDDDMFKKVIFTPLVLITTLVFAGSASAAILNVPAQYSTIQAAINAANPGDMISVSAGTYSENIDVSKGVSIISESGPLVTIVNASNPDDHVFNVTANNVSISGFTIKDARDTGYSGIFLSGANNINISYNNLTDNDAGIYLLSSSNNIVVNNTANSNAFGIWLDDSTSNTIASNNASTNYFFGIILYSSSNNTLTNNFANSNSYDGVYLYSSSGNTLTNNSASSNYFDGIYLDSSNSNIITNNTVSYNGDGIYLYESSNIDIINNIIYNNTGPGGIYNDGIRGDDNSSSVLIENSEIFNNSYGIDLDAYSDTTFNNFTIINNSVYSNLNEGLWIEYLMNSTIANNNASNNYIGIYLDSSNSNTLTNNTVNSNLDGIDLFYSSNNTIADNNASWNMWWGILLYSSNNNVIINNNANKNIEAGIFLFDSNGTNITNNQLSSDGWFGLLTFNSSTTKLTYNDLSNNLVGIYLYGSINDTLVENMAHLNEFAGIYLETSKNASITNNTARGNNISGFVLYESHNNLLLQNDATLNSWEGIILFNSTSNNLTGNNASSNSYFGIVIESSNQNILTNNIVESNYYFGILQYLSDNNFTNNTAYNLTEIIRGVRLYINEDVTPSLQSIDNSSNASYSLVIENLGIVYDTFVFNISNPDNSGTAYLNVQNISLNPGQKANLTLHVGDALPGGYSVTVEAVSINDENVSDSTNTLTIVYGVSQPSSTLSPLAVKDPAIRKSGRPSMENLIEQETFGPRVSNPGDRVHLKSISRSLTGNYQDMAEDYKARAKSEVLKAISKISKIMPTGSSITTQAASQSNQDAFGSTSALINSNWTNSNFSYSAVENSVINDSTIIKSMIFNSTVLNSSLSEVTLENALIINNSIIHGNITLKGITYSPYDFPISNILLGYDKRKSDLVGMTQVNKTLEVGAPNSNVSFSISTSKNYFAASLEVQRSGIQPIGVSNQTNNVGGYINIEASKNLKQGASWIYIKVYYNESQLGNIDENTLELQFYNAALQAWEDIPNSGVNTIANYVWANITHFSVFGIVGNIVTPVAPAGKGRGAVTVKSNPLKLTFTILTSSVMNDIIQQLGLTYKEFYTAPLSLASTLIVCGDYPAPSDLSAISLGKPVESMEGDVYELSAGWVMDHFLFVNTLIIARGDIPVDSMAGMAYAKSMNLPILLTKPDTLPEVVKDALQELNPSKIIILGGPEAVSMDVEAELAKIAAIERIWGATRFDTALELAKEISNPAVIVISSGYNPTVDAVISAAGYKAPLLYVKESDVPADVEDYIKANPRAKIIFDSSVSGAVKTQIEGLVE